MGYYTYHTLEIIKGPDTNINHAADISEASENGATLFEEPSKWRERGEVMREYSKQYPTTLFMIHGEGEEAGDLWDEYWQNGRHQYCPGRVEYDEYDLDKMA